MQEKAFHSVEEIDNFFILFTIRHRTIPSVRFIWRPVFQLGKLSTGEEADDTGPVPTIETLHRVINFEGHIDAVFDVANSVFENFLDLILFVFGLLDVFWCLVAALTQKTHDVLKTHVARSIRGRHDNDRVLVLFDQLFKQTEPSRLAMHLDFGESNLMLVGVNVASTQDPIGLEGLFVQHLALLELLNLFVSDR